jgi:hypothetical protein
MSNLPAKSDSESNEHLLVHSLGVVGSDVDDAAALEIVDAERIVLQLLADPDVTQQVTRRHCDGVDSIAGYFRCRFEPSQERAVLHVPIHPPMTEVPAVDACLVEDREGVRIRITDRQKFGARLEVIRSGGHDQPASVMVEVTLTASLQGTDQRDASESH